MMLKELGVLRLLLIIPGLLYLLAGYRIHILLIKAMGFLLGGVIGAGAIMILLESAEPLIAIIGLVVGGLVGAGLAVFVEKLVVFALGFSLGSLGGSGGYSMVVGSPPPQALLVALGIILGVALVGLYVISIVGVTSATGAILVGLAVNAHPLVWIVFFGFGVAVQSFIFKGSKYSRDTDKASSRSAIQEVKRLTNPESPRAIARKRLLLGEISEEKYAEIVERLSS